MTPKGSSSSPNSPAAGRNKDSFIRGLFDKISPQYDLFNKLSSFGMDQGWRRSAVRSLQLKPSMRVLDLASGTGDLACLQAETLAPLGLVAACDVSGDMLKYAGRKFERVPAARWHVRLIQGRAEALPFEDGSFDAATIGFALRNVTDLEQTFLELHRVLKPGGRIGLLEFGRPKNLFLRIGHWLWLTAGLPSAGFLTTGSFWPFTYLRRSILRFMPPEGVLERLKRAGFAQARAESFNGNIVVLYTGVKG